VHNPITFNQTCPTRHVQPGMSNQACPTRHVQPNTDMSEITRRSFVRKSTAAAAIAGNAAVLNGLINASASAGEGGTTQPGTTQPGTTGPHYRVDHKKWRVAIGFGSSSSAAIADANAKLVQQTLQNVTGYPTSPVPTSEAPGQYPSPADYSDEVDGPTEIAPNYWKYTITQYVSYYVVS
jgi:hypothetical protein